MMTMLLIVLATASVHIAWSAQTQQPHATPDIIAVDTVDTNFLPYVVKEESSTATQTPTQTATNTITPEPPTATPTPTSTQPTGVIVLSSSAFVPYSGSTSLYIVGEVRNDTASNVRFVRVNATLRDAAGNVVTNRSTYATIDVLTPGMTSPFRALFGDAPVWASYELDITWNTTTNVPYALEVLNAQSYFDSLYRFSCRRKIRNQYGESRSAIRAVVTIYDSEGK
ncbi:MAG: FxLYD domain-containing protein [Caldilineaceae bacterium]